MTDHEMLIVGGGNAGISLALPITYFRRILRGKV